MKDPRAPPEMRMAGATPFSMDVSQWREMLFVLLTILQVTITSRYPELFGGSNVIKALPTKPRPSHLLYRTIGMRGDVPQGLL